MSLMIDHVCTRRVVIKKCKGGRSKSELEILIIEYMKHWLYHIIVFIIVFNVAVIFEKNLIYASNKY